MNKVLLAAFAAMILLSESIRAQTPQFMTAGTWVRNPHPFAQNPTSSHRVQWLFHPADFYMPPAPGIISKIYVLSADDVANDPEYQHLTVRMGTTSMQITGNWALLDDTVFYSAAHTFTGGAAQNQWMELTLQHPFYYDGVSNLVVEAIHYGFSNGFGIFQDNTFPNRRTHGTATALNGTSAPGLLAFGFDRVDHGPHNAAAVAVTEPVDVCPGNHDLKLKILNTGSNRIDSVEVHWELDGAPQQPVTWRTLIDTIGSTGGNEAIITLGNIALGAAPRTIKVWTTLPNGQPDPFSQDDTLTTLVATSLTGTYTIGGTSPDFPDIGAAAEALNTRGICGPVTMNIRDGNYTSQRAVLNTIRGASTVNRVTFKSESNNPTAVSLSFDAPHNDTNHIFRLNAASYITIRDLTLTPVNATRHKAIEILGASSYDSVVNCRIIMPGPVATPINNHKTGIFGSGLTAESAHNVIADNIIENGAFGIYWYGVSNNRTYNHAFTGNTITGVGSKNIETRYVGKLVITNNTLSGRGTGTYHGIHCQDADSALHFSGNHISLKAPSPYGIELSACTADPGVWSLIENNRIYLDSTTSTTYGVRSQNTTYAVFRNNVISVYGTAGTTNGLYGTGNNVSYYHNSVRVTGNHATNTAAGYFSHNTNTNAIIRNNIFCNAGNIGLGMFSNYAGTMDADYNNVYAASGDLFRKSSGGNVTYTSLAAWQAASGYERYSISYPPAFLDTVTLEPDPAAAAVWSIHGRGEHITNVPTDINGDPRPPVRAAGVPDLGAYEFVPTSVPPAAVASPATPAAGTTQVFTFGSDTVGRITWAASSAVPASVAVRPYSGMQPPGIGAGRQMYFYTDVEAPAGTYNYTINLHYKEPWRGTMDTEGDIRLAKKNSSIPWMLYGGTASSVDVNANVITAAGLTDFSLFTGTDALVNPACAGTPQQADITNTPVTLCAGDSVQLTATDPNEQSGVSGLAYQWQQASSAGGTWANVSGGSGASTLSYTTPSLPATTFYRLRVTCTVSTQVSYSDTFEVGVLQPQPVTVTPGSHCGAGAVILGATGTSPVIWYDAATGGASLDTGATYTTPHLTTTTTYYVQAGNHCGPRTPVTATIYDLPDPEIQTTGSTTFCSGGSVILDAGQTYNSYAWLRDDIAISGATQNTYIATEDGNYRLTVTDNNSCSDTSASVQVTVYPAPVPQILFDGATLSTTDAFAAYQWHLNGADIPGATNREYIPEEDGAYTVTVDDETGCFATSAPYPYKVDVRSITDIADAISIYPNPVTDILYIRSPVPVHITVNSADGKTVLQQERAAKVHMGALAEGVYLMQITDAKGMLLRTERLVIVR